MPSDRDSAIISHPSANTARGIKGVGAGLTDNVLETTDNSTKPALPMSWTQGNCYNTNQRKRSRAYVRH
ncbi:MAG: hypothetical protein RIM23_22680 [Coleofasciculus sp. G3-WIS-01]|uniref:hypothetical protein n=1 Tax=Coleofasciculus sp. G3-WIS-01 TaxID=3069528 RepID=UPI0032F462E7